MEPDDTLCYCFDVPLRKVIQYFRAERPQKASQITECCSAGGGCQWCVPIIERLHEDVMAGRKPVRIEMTPDQAQVERVEYHRQTGFIERKKPDDEA